MNHKLIITKQKDHIISAVYDENDMIQVNVEKVSETSILGNIYIGKVKNIVKNINAAFVEIEDGMMCYLSLDSNLHPIFCNTKNNEKVNIGDEIIVQVIKESVKTKAPVVSANLNFTGKYIVLTHGKTMIGISNKIIDSSERNRLRDMLEQYKNKEYGFIIRTNATGTKEECIQEEIHTLIQIYENIKEYGVHRSPFSLIHKNLPQYICEIRDGYEAELDEIITDDRDIYQQIHDYLVTYQKEDVSKLRNYVGQDVSLNKLYNITTKLESALKEKVWLKSGANLIIQPTEALTVIDVNTSKAIDGKKKAEDTYYKINLEAAREIGKQLRLRNISGIIIIDFISMDTLEYRNNLLQKLREILSKDPVKTIVVDMTALDLVEITRKKVRKPLLEQCKHI